MNEYTIKNTYTPPIDDVNLLREKFIENFSKSRGWDKNNLSPNQMMEIISNSYYKNPLMMKS